jgi:hypothetical protein
MGVEVGEFFDLSQLSPRDLTLVLTQAYWDPEHPIHLTLQHIPEISNYIVATQQEAQILSRWRTQDYDVPQLLVEIHNYFQEDWGTQRVEALIDKFSRLGLIDVAIGVDVSFAHWPLDRSQPLVIKKVKRTYPLYTLADLGSHVLYIIKGLALS